MRDGERVRFVIRFDIRAHGRGAVFAELAPRYADSVRVATVTEAG